MLHKRAKNIPVSGRMILEKALMFAGEMGYLDCFKWLVEQMAETP